MEFKRIAVDTSKLVFTVHGVDEQDRPILRQNLTRAQFEKFFGKMSPTEQADLTRQWRELDKTELMWAADFEAYIFKGTALMTA